jgi:sensitive to high expression protein 9
VKGSDIEAGVAPAEVHDLKAVDLSSLGENVHATEQTISDESTITPIQASQPEQPVLQTEKQHEQHSPRLDVRDPATWRPSLEDLFSTRLIQLRKQDVTTIALEGAATGAALTALIATLIFRSS